MSRLPRLPRRAGARLALGVAVVLASASVIGACGGDDTAAGAGDQGSTNREAARILDSVPLPPGAEATDVRDRQREYVVPTSAAEVTAYLRTALPNAGWTERAASSAPTQTTGSNTGGQGSPSDSSADGSTGDSDSDLADRSDDPTEGNGPEVGNRGPDGGGVDAGSDETLPQRMRTVFTRSGDRLVVVVRPIADADPQTGSSAGNAQDQSTLRLTVHVD